MRAERTLATPITTTIDTGIAIDSTTRPRWDALAIVEPVNLPFAFAAWQDAWRAHLDDSDQAFRVLAFADGVLIAAASFARYGSTLAFAGRGASDYCAILIAPDLDDHSTKVVVDALLQAALTAAPRARELRLARMHPTSRALPALRESKSLAARLQEVGGRLSISSTIGAGTEAVLWVP
jgi:hypothetical protein